MATETTPLSREAATRKKTTALNMLAEACELFSQARRKRSNKFPFTTLNEEAAISILRVRLADLDAAEEASRHAR